MKSSMKRALMILIAFLIGSPLVSCTGENARPKEPSTTGASVPPGVSGEHRRRLEETKRTVAAKVNGVPISQFDLAAEMNAISRQPLEAERKKDPKAGEKIRKEALDRLIWRELAVQEAKKQGMKAPAYAVDEELKRIKSEMKTEEAFRQNLAKSGITEEDLKGRIERSLLVESITEKEIFGKATVDLSGTRKIYDRKKDSYKGPMGPMSFEEARPMIEMELKTSAVRKREDEWVAALKKGARIEIAP